MDNNNINEIQKQRIKINLSLKICENVLEDFSNIVFMEVNLTILKKESPKKLRFELLLKTQRNLRCECQERNFRLCEIQT